jgi:aryl-alcohol dehydrogenase-like predicted oxidoreductase
MGRTSGRSGIEVSDVGFGCWAIGGPFTWGGRPDGWGESDDGESVAAIRLALDQGVTLFDTRGRVRGRAQRGGARPRPGRSP